MTDPSRRFKVVAYESQRIALWDCEEKAFVTIHFDENDVEILKVPRRSRRPSEPKRTSLIEEPVVEAKPERPWIDHGMFRPAQLPVAKVPA